MGIVSMEAEGVACCSMMHGQGLIDSIQYYKPLFMV